METAKKAMKYLLCSFCLIVMFSLCPDVFAEAVPQEVTAAAENGLHPFLQRIPPAELGHYGFTRDDALDRAYAGIPFKVYTITPSALSHYKAGDTVSSLLSPTGMWYFPIMVNGDMRAVLTVDQLHGAWRAVAIGKASLARELEEVVRQWPRSRGYEPLLVMVFQAQSYFFTVPQKDAYNLTPFIFAGKGFGAEFQEGREKYASTVELPSVIGKLKTAVKENIRWVP